jgi:CRISPR-associated protein Cas6
MYWEEDNQDNSNKTDDKIVDISFKVNCAKISADHAYDLFKAVIKRFPQINKIDNLAIHSVHGAESGAGWERPDTEIYLSKRTRFCIRTPMEFADEFYSLDGEMLKVGKYEMKLSKPSIKKLVVTDTLFCRSVVVENNKNEDEFLEDVNSSLKSIDIDVKKMLCGKEHIIKIENKKLIGKTLLITDLEKKDSIKIQQLGIGIGKLYGCGIFLPHKSIAPVAISKSSE